MKPNLGTMGCYIDAVYDYGFDHGKRGIGNHNPFTYDYKRSQWDEQNMGFEDYDNGYRRGCLNNVR